MKPGLFAGELRRELMLRNRRWARGRLHVESYGGQPVIVYCPEHPTGEDVSAGRTAQASRHGNFFDPAYAAIASRPEWARRFNKVHAQGARTLPRPFLDPARRWRELDSSMSSDALLMNVFCTPGVAESAALRSELGVDGDAPREDALPEFGWKARVPLRSGLFDRTEVDMRWGSLLVEAKLTETDFQTRKAGIVEAYRDFETVFEKDLLPRAEIPVGRRREAVEFPEDYTQEYEPPVLDPDFANSIERTVPPPVEPGYASYQLIRNVLAAHAQSSSFCVIHDQRRPDLREAWFKVMAAVKHANMRVRLKVLTWQELAGSLPDRLQQFLDLKYGIVSPGQTPSPVEDADIDASSS
jgi:hypothetical protein